MKFIPILLLIIIIFLPAVTLLSLRKEIGLKQTDEYKKVFFHSKQDFIFSFISPKEKLNSVILKMWNLSIDNNKPIYFKLLSGQTTIRHLTLNDVNIGNGDMVRFTFPVITDSKDKRFTLILSAPDTQKDDVLGVYTNASGDPVITTYHTLSSRLLMISNSYKNLSTKIFADRAFGVIWLLLFGSIIFVIKSLDI